MPGQAHLPDVPGRHSRHGRIKAGGQKNHQGTVLSDAIAEGLVREDGKCLYIIDDGIPNMLIDERIDL